MRQPQKRIASESRRHHVQFRTGGGVTWRVAPSKNASQDGQQSGLEALCPSQAERKKRWLLTALAAGSFCACLCLGAWICEISADWLGGQTSPVPAQHSAQLVASKQASLRTQAQVLNERGMQLVAQSKFDQAADCFQKAIAIDGNLTAAHNNLALTYVQAGDYPSACSVLQNAMLVSPDNQYASSLLKMLRPKTEHEELADTGANRLF